MPAISKAKHYKLIVDIKKFIKTLKADVEGKTTLEIKVSELEIFFNTYQVKLSDLHELIQQYDAMEHLVKLQCRKQQLIQIKQKNALAI